LEFEERTAGSEASEKVKSREKKELSGATVLRMK
jgi:hypothetical protein